MPKSQLKILWLIQSNQFTPIISEYLKLLQTRMEKLITLSFIVPETSKDSLPVLTNLTPSCVPMTSRSAVSSFEGYKAKKTILSHKTFSQGLEYADALLLDDLGAGNIVQTQINLKKTKDLCGLILQVPTPLGSSDNEERVFQAAVMWAKQNQIPVIGYELLPLDTRWTLAATLPDGIITRTPESFEHLKNSLDHENIWLLPNYEGAIFSSVSTQFNLNGVKASYHYRSTHKIPETRTVIYLPHNVAMTYEYQDLLRIISPLGKNLHLMFNFGKDQARGAYTHEQMIKMIYEKELAHFASYSFHNMNSPWEMLTADAAVACSPCFQTVIAQEKNLPAIIYDPLLPPAVHGLKQRVNTRKQLLTTIQAVITAKKEKTEFGTILIKLARSMSQNDSVLEK